MTGKMTRVVWALAAALAVGGCAGGPNARHGSEYSQLYGGESLAHVTALPLSTASEGIAQGDAAWQRGDRDTAVYEYVRALELAPEDYDTLTKIGDIQAEQEDWQRAGRAYRMALTHKADHGPALEGLGLVLLRERRHEEALEQLTRADEVGAGWRTQNGLGVLADLRRDHQTAQFHYHLALQRAKEVPLLHNNLGYSLYLAGDLESAAISFRDALRLAPGYRQARRNLGLVHARKGEYVRAIDTLAQVMERPQALNDVGYFCLSVGDHTTAERFFREAMRASPNYYPVAARNLDRAKRSRAVPVGPF